MSITDKATSLTDQHSSSLPAIVARLDAIKGRLDALAPKADENLKFLEGTLEDAENAIGIVAKLRQLSGNTP